MAERYMVGSDTVAILWKRYVEDQSLEPKQRGVSVSKLGEQETDLIQQYDQGLHQCLMPIF